jgi:adenylate cyclase
MSGTVRRLAAIMFTDMVGYTALTQTDEQLALELLEKQRSVLRPIFQTHLGREVKTIGDAFLVEFDSALEATLCAVELQTALHDYNASVTDERKIRLRVGIHLGDVAHRQDDVFGDAVNIASRIEPLAEPEGVCISQQVFDQVRNKVKIPLVRLETAELEGVRFPIDVFRLVLPWEGGSPPSLEMPSVPTKRIAVLPFANMSPDPRDEYFADGMTEEMISTLSKISELRVSSRTSVMRYKRTDKGLNDISRELGVMTVMEGSVRKSGEDLRIGVQLIDAKKDEHLWSEDYDRKLMNVFAIQREIADQVASALRANFLAKEVAHMKRDETREPAAYIHFLQGRHLLHESTEASLRQSVDFFSRAIDLDPTFARAYATMAEARLALGNGGYEPFSDSVSEAEGLIARALQLNPALAEAHSMLGLIRFTEDRYGDAESEARQAIQLNPSLPDPYLNLSNIRAVLGHIGEALRLAETAYQLDPLTPRAIGLYGHLQFYAGDETGVLDYWKRTEQFAPYLTNLYLTEFHFCKRDFAKAEETTKVLERLSPSDPRSIMARGSLDAFIGGKRRALEAVRRLDESSKVGSANVNAKGFIYWALGDTDIFFECMSKAAEIHALPGITLRYSPLYSGARNDPRYRELFKRIGIDV